MSNSKIPPKVQHRLWACSAGRCQYCNKPLWEDLFTKTQYSTAYIAHIIAEKSNGPRGDPILSDRLKHEFSNLMLLCDEHHRLIDKEDIEGHPVERLQEMKRSHEERVQIQTSLGVDHQSHILHYGAKIGRLASSITWEQSKDAMFPRKYPAESHAIELNLKNSPFEDSETSYWSLERVNLYRQFEAKVQHHLGNTIKHISVFAKAPIPLLIDLGRLVSDVNGVDVYQHQKEPEDNWKWVDHDIPIDYKIIPPSSESMIAALNLSLSANIDNSRITSTLGENVSIWTLTINKPYNDFLKSRSQLQAFREIFRTLLNQIKLRHGQNQTLHLFPAIPVAIAIEIGKSWMPKADLPLQIYDQNSKVGGFVQAFRIENNFYEDNDNEARNSI